MNSINPTKLPDENNLKEAIVFFQKIIHDQTPTLLRVAELVLETLRRKGRIFLLGGGSGAKLTERIASEFVSRFKPFTILSPAFALNPESPLFTGLCDRSSPEKLLALQIERFCSIKDFLILFEWEDSPCNFLEAAQTAHRLDIPSIGINVKPNSPLIPLLDQVFELPFTRINRIYEFFHLMGNILEDVVEREFPQELFRDNELVNGWEAALEESRRLQLKHPYPPPEISIVIPTMNRKNYLVQCLDRIFHYAERSFEIILADDSTDGTSDAIHAKYDNTGRVLILHNETRKGVITSCNLGLAAAVGKYVVTLNDDLYVLKGWDSSLVRLVENEPSCGAAAPLLLETNGTIQRMGMVDGHRSRKYPELTPVFGSRGWNARGKTPDQCPESRWVRECECSGLYLLRREVLYEIGGLDTRYRKYFADVDWGLRIRLAGYRILYCPKSVMVHFTLSREERKETDDLFQWDLKIYREKWGIYILDY